MFSKVIELTIVNNANAFNSEIGYQGGDQHK